MRKTVLILLLSINCHLLSAIDNDIMQKDFRWCAGLGIIMFIALKYVYHIHRGAFNGAYYAHIATIHNKPAAEIQKEVTEEFHNLRKVALPFVGFITCYCFHEGFKSKRGG